jgi:hypothetical protein
MKGFVKGFSATVIGAVVGAMGGAVLSVVLLVPLSLLLLLLPIHTILSLPNESIVLVLTSFLMMVGAVLGAILFWRSFMYPPNPNAEKRACLGCKYDLYRCEANCCPECGKEIPPWQRSHLNRK